MEVIGILSSCMSVIGFLLVLVTSRIEIRKGIHHNRMEHNEQALENRKVWVILDQKETREQLIRDWKDLKIPCSDKRV